MKRIMLFIYPLIITWDVLWKVPGICPKEQEPNPYSGSCLLDARSQVSREFTEKQDYEAWVTNIPKNDPHFTITNIKIFEYDDKRTPEIKK